MFNKIAIKLTKIQELECRNKHFEILDSKNYH